MDTPWLTAAAMLCTVVAQVACWAQEAQQEWGPVWQPNLSERERHPFLFYDEVDRDRMWKRLKQESA